MRQNRTKAMVLQKAGFTLLEVLLAMAVLAMALVAVLQMQVQSISMSGESRFMTTASLLAASKMADIEAEAVPGNRDLSGNFAPDHAEYAWTTRVTDAQIGKLKKIEVTVFNKEMTRDGAYQLVLYKMSGM